MTEEEARIVLGIMVTADGGCHVCGLTLLHKFHKHFPQFLDIAVEVFEKEHEWGEPESVRKSIVEGR